MRCNGWSNRVRAIVVVFAVASALVVAACGGGSGSARGAAPSSSILPTTTTMPHAPRVRVVGDGNASVDASALATALGTTDLVDLSHADASLASLLDLPADPANPDEGRLHDTLEQVVADAPEFVVISLGAEVFDERAPMANCGDTMGVEQFDACVSSELDRLHFDQRIMAIALDMLAHTRDTKVVLLRIPPAISATGLLEWQRDEVVKLVDRRIDAAAALTAEGGANWADRSVVADPGGTVEAARARGWLA